MRFACAAAFHEQREAEHRLQPRESRPLESCHNSRVIESLQEDVRARVPSTLNFSNISIQESRVFVQGGIGWNSFTHCPPPVLR